jgi:hypothetical protein
VDDLLLIIPRDQCDNIVETFNQYDECLKFTIETEVEQSINFLDITIKYDNLGKITTKWYKKDVASNRFVNFNSTHIYSQKINSAYNLKNKALALSDQIYHVEIKQKIFDILQSNEYPRTLINYMLNNNRIKRQIVSNKDQPYFTLPYVPILSDKIKYMLKPLNINITYKYIKTVKRIFSKIKDNTPHELKSNVIYKINCKNCSACYTGQTKNYVKTRAQQHKNDIKNFKTNLPIPAHCVTEKHLFDFDNIEILDEERNYYKRLVKEMIYIKLNQENINIQMDTNNLSQIYSNILKLMK